MSGRKDLSQTEFVKQRGRKGRVGRERLESSREKIMQRERTFMGKP